MFLRRHVIHLAVGVLLTCGVACSSLEAQDASDGDAVSQIRETAAEFLKAFNEHRPAQLAKMWTEEGEYTNESGQRFVGREQIADEYSSFFKAMPTVKMNVSIESIRLLSPTTAIEEGTATLEPMPPGTPAASRYTAIHVLDDGKWRMASVRDARVELPSAFQQLSGLGWLVGRWKAEHEGVTVRVVGSWIAKRSYIQRRFESSKNGQPVSSSVEVIGWDAIQGQLTSWTFESGGGRSVGVWTPTEEGWLVREVGASSDGLPTSGVAWWMPLPDRAIGWSAALRTINGVALADPRDVVLKPQSPSGGEK